MKVTVIALALLALTACATAPTAEQLAAADYGPYPEDYRAQILEYMRRTFNDPDSVKDLRITKPAKNYTKKSGFSGGWDYYWVSTVECNAKNKFGAYTGLQRYFVTFKSGRIEHFLGPS